MIDNTFHKIPVTFFDVFRSVEQPKITRNIQA